MRSEDWVWCRCSHVPRQGVLSLVQWLSWRSEMAVVMVLADYRHVSKPATELEREITKEMCPVQEEDDRGINSKFTHGHLALES